jgi:hypothetical protein
MRSWAIGLCGVALAWSTGCAKSAIGPNIAMTRVPAGLNWCAPSGPRRPAVGNNNNSVRVIHAERLNACTDVLLTENPYLDRDFWEASIFFGLSTNELGELTEVCVWDGSLGNPDGYVTSIANALKTGGLALPPNQRKTPWELVFKMIYD